MGLETNLEQDNLPKPRQGLRFVKNENGVREQKIVDTSEEILEIKERGIVLVGAHDMGHIGMIQNQIMNILQTHDEIPGPILIVAGEPSPKDDHLSHQGENSLLREGRKSNELILTRTEELVETFILPPKKTPDFKQRQFFHQKYTPKPQMKKGKGHQRTKQRKK